MDNNNPNPVLGEIEKRVLDGASAVSSESSAIDTTISSAIQSAQATQKAGESRIRTDAAETRRDITGQTDTALTTANESRRGFGTQLAAMRMLTEQTDSALRDLDKREQDALLANDAQAMSQISALKVKQLEFKQQKEQQFFENMFKFEGLNLQKSAQEQAKQQFTATFAMSRLNQLLDKEEKMATLAAQAGVEFAPGDTFESLSVKIASIADEERKAKAQERLDRLAGESKDKEQELVFDDILSSSISDGMNAIQAANQVVTTMREAGQLLSRDEYNRIYAKALELETEYKKTLSKSEAEQGGGFLSKLGGFMNRGNRFQYETTPMFGKDVSTSTSPAAPAPEEVFFGIDL